jgi:hypothetical protein
MKTVLQNGKSGKRGMLITDKIVCQFLNHICAGNAFSCKFIENKLLYLNL